MHGDHLSLSVTDIFMLVDPPAISESATGEINIALCKVVEVPSFVFRIKMD